MTINQLMKNFATELKSVYKVEPNSIYHEWTNLQRMAKEHILDSAQFVFKDSQFEDQKGMFLEDYIPPFPKTLLTVVPDTRDMHPLHILIMDVATVEAFISKLKNVEIMVRKLDYMYGYLTFNILIETNQYYTDDYINLVLKDGSLIQAPLTSKKQTTEEIQKRASMAYDQVRDLTLIFLTLLSCKNIVIKDRTYEKKGRIGVKKELDYKEIHIRLPGKGIVYRGKQINEIPYNEREHYGLTGPRRGHFKTYTPDAPLFGKWVGTFYWHSIVGSGKDKTYIVDSVTK